MMANEQSAGENTGAGVDTLPTMSHSSAKQNQAIQALISPQAIAIVGASSDPGKWGARPIRYLRKFGYQGEIYPVNPKYDSVLGLRCYQSIADLPMGVDLALVILPANLITTTIRELGARGVKSVIIFSSGFAEMGTKGQVLQHDLMKAAMESGVRLCGPNCLGIINIYDGIAACTSSALEMDELIYEPISIISQSGAIGLASVLNRGQDHGVGFSRMISTGNEADLELADFIDYLVHDPATRVISFYAEGFHHGRRLFSACDRALATGKPVIGLLAGQTQEGRKSTISHTGLLAEDGPVIGDIFRQFGVVMATELDDLYEKAALFSRCEEGGGRRVAVVTTSGGIGSILTDLCVATGLNFPALEQQTYARLRDLLPSFNPVNNPLDISGQFAGDAQLFFSCLKAVLQDPNIETCILVLTIMKYEPLVELLLQENFRPKKPLLILFTGGSLSMPSVTTLERSQRYPIFWRADKCVEAVADLANYREWRLRRLAHQEERIAWKERSDVEEDEENESVPLKPLTEIQSRMLLGRYGIPTPKERVVTSLEEAITAATAIGYPVAVKLHGAGVTHKTELGGVCLNLGSIEELAEAFAKLEQVCSQANLPVEVLVQEMVADGLEVLVGMTHRSRLGPVISLGAGGILVELLNRPSFRVAPLFPEDVAEMLRESGLSRLLDGYRGQPARDIAKLVDVVLAVSHMSLEIRGVREIDLNPIMVRSAGQGVVPVDSLVVMQDDQSLIEMLEA